MPHSDAFIITIMDQILMASSRHIRDKVLIAEKPGTILAVGMSWDTEWGVNFKLTGEKVKWVAVKGRNNEWTVFFGNPEAPQWKIMRYGRKVNGDNVRNLVQASDFVMRHYSEQVGMETEKVEDNHDNL